LPDTTSASTNLGKWDRVLTERPVRMLGGRYDGPQPIALTETYRLGADWLAGCASVEDWGCGLGWMRTLVAPGRYRGIDGSRTPFADEVRDLVEYRSCTPGLFMRHVLEHNHAWAAILDNAVASFTQRMVLVLFTPMSACTRVLEVDNQPWVDAPNISFSHADLVEHFGRASHTFEDVEGGGYYRRERIYYLQKLCEAGVGKGEDIRYPPSSEAADA
jgi:hypothetical protein